MIITYEYKGRVQDIEFDATINAAYQSASQITEHPVETGSNVNDHIRALPDRFSVEAMVSNTPIVVPTTQMRGVTGSVQSVALQYDQVDRFPLGLEQKTPRSASVNVLRFDGEFDRVRDVYAELKLIEQNGLTFSIRTVYRGGLVDFTDMAIASMTVPADVASGSAKTFQIDFQKIKIVETRKVKVQGKSATKKKGQKPKKEVKGDDKKKLESTLHAAKDRALESYKSLKAGLGL